MSVTKEIVDALQGWHFVEVKHTTQNMRKDIYQWLIMRFDAFDFFVIGGLPYKIAFHNEADATMFRLVWAV